MCRVSAKTLRMQRVLGKLRNRVWYMDGTKFTGLDGSFVVRRIVVPMVHGKSFGKYVVNDMR
jgi:hypothetical protein